VGPESALLGIVFVGWGIVNFGSDKPAAKQIVAARLFRLRRNRRPGLLDLAGERGQPRHRLRQLREIWNRDPFDRKFISRYCVSASPMRIGG
jgi:hypothetical protein